MLAVEEETSRYEIRISAGPRSRGAHSGSMSAADPRSYVNSPAARVQSSLFDFAISCASFIDELRVINDAQDADIDLSGWLRTGSLASSVHECEVYRSHLGHRFLVNPQVYDLKNAEGCSVLTPVHSVSWHSLHQA